MATAHTVRLEFGPGVDGYLMYDDVHLKLVDEATGTDLLAMMDVTQIDLTITPLAEAELILHVRADKVIANILPPKRVEDASL